MLTSYADPVKVYKLLRKEFGEVKTPLTFQKPYELAIAVILSAQCTDEQVNKVTPVLFSELPSLESIASAKLSKIEKLIYSTGFYKNKARSIQNFAKTLLEKHNSNLPDTLEQLIELPGVGRKTANVILNEVFRKAEGIVVDTHVKRLSAKLGYTKETEPEKIELDLMNLIPERYWLDISLYLIFLGRKYCKARKPLCKECILRNICPSAE